MSLEKPMSGDAVVWRSRLASFLSDNRIAARVLALLCLLIGVKLGLLASLQDHLFHTHWRVRTLPPTWFEQVNFYLFAVLVVASVLMLGRELRHAPVIELRFWNAGLAAVGLLFVVLSFHRMDNNYLLPWMNGVFNLGDLTAYLVQDSCFDPPYLVIYPLGFALAYWLLQRSGRERWTIVLLALIAGIYLILNLRELELRGRELAVLNGLAVAGIVAWRIFRKPLGWGWLMVGTVVLVGGWMAFALVNPELWQPEPVLYVLIATSLALLALASVFARKSVAWPLFTCFLPFYFTSFLLLSSHHYPLAANLNHLAVFALSASHYFWQEALFSALLLGGWAILRRSSERGARWFFDIGAVLLLLSVMVDLGLTRAMEVRLDWHAITMNTDPRLLWPTIETQAGRAGLVLLGLLVLYALLSRPVVLTNVCRWSKSAWVAPLAVYFAVHFIVVAVAAPKMVNRDKAEGISVANVIASSPLAQWKRARVMKAGEFEKAISDLGLSEPLFSNIPGEASTPPRDWNVLLIVLESSYNRYLSMFGAKDETQPLLKKYRDRMELFPNFYSVFPSSLNARFSVVSGLYPCRPYAIYVNPRVEAKSLFEIMHDTGRKVSLFDSCYRNYQNWGDYVRNRQVDIFHDADTMPGRENHAKVSWGVREEVTMEAMKAQFAQHAARNERFFMTYMPVAPHMPFDTFSKQFDQFNEGLGPVDGNYVGRYKNQLLYIDWVLASLLDELDRLQLLQKTLVVITDDHGEMVGDMDRKLGHGWNLDPVLCNVPLIVMNPERPGYRVNPRLSSQVDILPTVLDLLGIPMPAGELYQGESLFNPEVQQNKVVYLSSHRHRAMVKGNQYFLEIPGEGEGSGSGQGTLKVYDITIDGVKTDYKLVRETNSAPAMMRQFDDFQISFLTHYARYRQMMNAESAVVAKSRAKR